MIDIKTLLPELKKLVTDLSEDLLARSTDDTEIDAGLREAYKQIEKGGRTGAAFEVWREDYLDQVAVGWVLACVFVRFMEDNDLIDECYLAGEGDRRTKAENEHELYFRAHPKESDREYFEHVFHEVGKIPACHDLFAEGKTPLWAVGPSGDAAMKLLAFWRDIDTDSGRLSWGFHVEDGNTRFLGDLYQELSEAAQKKFALKQTPVFVEEFILDRTLNPAIDEYSLDEVRLLDPTCGSAHFMLGAFARLFALWMKRESNERVAAQKALDGVWGVDVNPFAVAIARFRLMVAATRACGISRLKNAPGWNVHVATGDSLLFGSRWDEAGNKKPQQQFLGTSEQSWAPEIYACEDKEAISEVLGQQYHAVVGNPPYITVKDKSLNQAYRDRYITCHRKYSLAVPFTERFFDLACPGGFVGMLTANSFMKREFGKKLIETYLPKIELTHVIDTAGAYIPGHGTPTVILFGRDRLPTQETVRAVLGIKGEPETLDDPSKGLVWTSILSHVDKADSQNEYVSTADIPRKTLYSHPWSLGGGGASELHAQLVSACGHTLKQLVDVIGVFGMTNADEVFLASRTAFERRRVETSVLMQFQIGDEIRDWVSEIGDFSIFPYDEDAQLIGLDDVPHTAKWLWASRTSLGNRATFGKGTYFSEGLPWWKWHQIALDRLETPLTIVFPFVASHNHFVLDKGGKVYNRSAPILKLPSEATEDDHLELLGLLNSSVMCFLMKQVSQQKQMTGGDGVRVQSRAKVPYEFAITQMKRLPIPSSFKEGSLLRQRIGKIAKSIAACVEEMKEHSYGSALSQVLNFSASVEELRGKIDQKNTTLLERMVFLQEEIDFCTYVLYGLADESCLCPSWEDASLTIAVGTRPFEIVQGSNLDGFSVAKSVPASWSSELQRIWSIRIGCIEGSKSLRLIEDDHYKRRWIGRQGLFNHTARQDRLKIECKEWLLNRLEDARYWDRRSPVLRSIAELASLASSDEPFQTVGAAYRGRDDFDNFALVTELVEDEGVPLLPILRLKKSGLRKLDVWKRTWEAQRNEDATGEYGTVPAPPSYATGDFANSSYWRHRNKLDVAQERFVLFPHCESDGDSSLVVGWAGWNHLEQATAIVHFYDARKREGWTAERLKPLLAAVDELLPWIHQWHPEIDPEYNETAGTSFQTLLESETQEHGLTLEDIRSWTPPKKTARRKRKKASS